VAVGKVTVKGAYGEASMVLSSYIGGSAMSEEKKTVNLREGVIKYTKPPVNRTPPSQRTAAAAQTKKQ